VKWQTEVVLAVVIVAGVLAFMITAAWIGGGWANVRRSGRRIAVISVSLAAVMAAFALIRLVAGFWVGIGLGVVFLLGAMAYQRWERSREVPAVVEERRRGARRPVVLALTVAMFLFVAIASVIVALTVR
jgi:hypothetical protein